MQYAGVTGILRAIAPSMTSRCIDFWSAAVVSLLLRGRLVIFGPIYLGSVTRT
jgi:hypothetical protein